MDLGTLRHCIGFMIPGHITLGWIMGGYLHFYTFHEAEVS
jgi:hypothetical protein